MFYNIPLTLKLSQKLWQSPTWGCAIFGLKSFDLFGEIVYQLKFNKNEVLFSCK